MPVAVIQEWREEETDRSTVNYDAINDRLGLQENPPPGLIVHTAGFFGEGFRVFDVWESMADFERFMREQLQPLLDEFDGADAPPPEVSTYELHSVIRG